MITVLGRTTSSNVQAVIWALSELNLPFDRQDFGHKFGGTQTPEYLALNPMGLVPVLQDDGHSLFESAAIVRYLAAKYGDDNFYPNDPGARAQIDVWAEWVKTSFYSVIIGEVFFPLVRKDPAKLNNEQLNRSVKKLNKLAGMLDHRLGDGPWIGGQNFTFGDIACGHLLYRFFDLPFERDTLANLTAYYDRLTQREAFAKHMMVSYEPLRWAQNS